MRYVCVARQWWLTDVSYSFTEKAFDGLAWNTPWFLMANYMVLAVAIAFLLLTRSRFRRP